MTILAKINRKVLGLSVLAIIAIVGAMSAGAQDEKLLGLNLNLPLLGADAFEPDNTPKNAVWSGLQKVVTGLLGLVNSLLSGDSHNLHVIDDVDWSKFEAAQGVDVKVETFNVGALADTQITVYRLMQPGEPLPTVIPPGCTSAWIQGPDGELLAVIAYNDDFGGTGAQAKRSVVNFIAPKTGTYYSKVSFSAKITGLKGQIKADDTSYDYAASSKATMCSTLYVSVKNSTTNAAVTTATVALSNGAKTTRNSNGVYTFAGLPSGTYKVTTSASTYNTATAYASLGNNTSTTMTFKLVKSAKADEAGVTEEDAAAFDFAAPFGEVTFEEVLRLVQLYNAGGFHCDATSDDGFAPGAGALECEAHPLDANHDSRIDLSELLTGVQYYKLGYHHCESGLCANAE